MDNNLNRDQKSISSITSTGRTEIVYLAGAGKYFVQTDVTVLSAVTGCSIKLQGSETGASGTFNDVADSSQAVTATGTKSWSVKDVTYNFLAIVYAMSDGNISVVQTVNRRRQ